MCCKKWWHFLFISSTAVTFSDFCLHGQGSHSWKAHEGWSMHTFCHFWIISIFLSLFLSQWWGRRVCCWMGGIYSCWCYFHREIRKKGEMRDKKKKKRERHGLLYWLTTLTALTSTHSLQYSENSAPKHAFYSQTLGYFRALFSKCIIVARTSLKKK